MKSIYLISKKNETIKVAMEKIKRNGARTLVILDDKKKLIGTLSEGDIQKALLSQATIHSKINNFFNRNPKKVDIKKLKKIDLKKFFITGQYGLIPVVNKNNQLKNIITFADVFSQKEVPEIKLIDVIIMAGGKGTRLKPITEILPKPLIPINNKPMLEHIIDNFKLFNFKKFHLIINHQGELIKSYFNSLKNKQKIYFTKEKKPLGTIGGLSLIKKNISENFIISNCDNLFKIDYQKFYKTHINNDNKITIVVSKKQYEFPYGFCKVKSQRLLSVNEKPKYNFIANAGLYLMNKDIIKLIKKNKFLDMTDLIKKCLKTKIKIGVFSIESKDWIDLGQLSDLKKVFKDI